MLAKLSRHPDNPADVSGLALAVAHSLAGAGGAAGGAPDGHPVFDISDIDEDAKPDVKTEDGGAGSSTRGRRGGGRGCYGVRWGLLFRNICKTRACLRQIQ
jgi:hypothetical protein